MSVAVGQVWTYDATQDCPQLIVTIGRIDSAADLGADPGNSDVVSVSINLPEDARSDSWPDIAHLPFASSALAGGVQVMDGASLPATFADGYDMWRAELAAGTAGVFTLPPQEAYLAVVDFYANQDGAG